MGKINISRSWVCANNDHPIVGVRAASRASHSFISLLTQQSLTPGSSSPSSCLRPFLNKCSMAATSLAPTDAACVRKEYLTKRRNLGWLDGGFVRTIRRALRNLVEESTEREHKCLPSVQSENFTLKT